MTPNNKTKGPQAIVIWVLWLSFATALVMYRIMLVSKAANTRSLTAPDTIVAWVCYVIPIVVVFALRWLVIPRLKQPIEVLPVFLVGVALAETLTFFGLFLFPAQFRLFYLMSWLLFVQLMPTWTIRPGQSGG
jgi:hypothetical protein